MSLIPVNGRGFERGLFAESNSLIYYKITSLLSYRIVIVKSVQ
jgi:hypothetical protein